MNAETNNSFWGKVQPWLVVVSASLFFFFGFMQMTLFNTLNEHLMREFSINASGLSQLSAVFIWADVLCLIPAGLMLDRYSNRLVLSLALLICSAAVWGFASTHSFAMALGCRAVMGMVYAFSFIGCMQLASRWFPSHQLALAMGSVVTMGMLGGLGAQAPVNYLLSHLHWRQVMIMDAGVGVLLSALMYWGIRDFPKGVKVAARATQAVLGPLKVAARNPQNWYSGLYIGLINMPLMVLGALWGNVYVQKVFKLDPQAAAASIGMLFVGMIVGSPLMGVWSDRWKRRRAPMLWVAILCLGVLLVMQHYESISPLGMAGLMLALGFLSSGQCIGYPLIAESNAPEYNGSAMSLASILIMSIAALGQMLFGFLVQYYWNGMSFHGEPVYDVPEFQKAALSFSVAVALSIVMAFQCRETGAKAYGQSERVS